MELSFALARAVSGPVRSRSRFMSLWLGVSWFFLLAGIPEIMLWATLLALNSARFTPTVLWICLARATASTVLAAMALWRLERRRQSERSSLLF